MTWNSDLQVLMGKTSKYMNPPGHEDDLTLWNALIGRIHGDWENIIGANFILSEELDEEDQVEHQLLGDDEEVEEDYEESEDEV